MISSRHGRSSGWLAPTVEASVHAEVELVRCHPRIEQPRIEPYYREVYRCQQPTDTTSRDR